MSIAENKNAVRRLVEEAENQGNLDVVDEGYAPDHSVRATEWGNRPSLDSIKQHILRRRAGFPDAHTTIDALLAEGDLVAAYFTITGTQTSEYQGIPATHKVVRTTSMAVYRFAHGKIVETLSVGDTLGFLVQLDALWILQGNAAEASTSAVSRSSSE